MIVFDPHGQFAFTQACFQTLAGMSLAGGAHGMATLVEEDALAAAEGGQRADDMQRLSEIFQLPALLAQLQFDGAWQAFAQAVQALAQQGQGAAWVLGV